MLNYWARDALRHLHIHLSGIAYGPKGERNIFRYKDSDHVDGLFRALKIPLRRSDHV